MAINKDKKRVEEQTNGQLSHNIPPNDEQLLRRQSAPRPTIEDEARRVHERRQAQALMGQGAVNGFDALEQKIGKEQVQEAYQTLMKYKEGKANLERKIIDNEPITSLGYNMIRIELYKDVIATVKIRLVEE